MFHIKALEIMVGHLTFSDQNWYLSEHVLFWLDLMSNHNFFTRLILSVGRNFTQTANQILTVFLDKNYLMSEQVNV